MRSIMKNGFKEFIFCFIVLFLFAFMLFIFGPSEIFFTNSNEFEFVYGEFAFRLTCYGFLFSLMASVILIFLPKVIRNIFIALFSALSVAGYIQVMFLNKNLDLLGVSPEGYVVEKKSILINSLIWIVIFAIFLIGIMIKERNCKKCIEYVSVCLLLIQGVAFGSLFIGADKSSYERLEEENWYLSAEKQYTVSADKNIIVLVLDYFSNQYLEYTYASNKYPDLFDGLKDFTFYNNADCAYYGTFPSMPHMLTGQEVDPSIPINDWTKKIWNDGKVNEFYQSLRDKNYEVNLFTSEMGMLCAGSGSDILCGKFDNLVKTNQNILVDYSRLEKIMMKLSAFRLFPNVLKAKVYVQLDEYQDIVQYKNNNIVNRNYEFYEDLLEKGLALEKEKNSIIIQHLLGTHLFTTGDDGHYNPNSTMEETVKGCFVMVEEYIKQLKKLGVYDDATIIVTADHGEPKASQVVFFMKNPYEQHEKMTINTAPISLCDLLPTIGKVAGIPYEQMGRAVSDVDEGEERERAVWVRYYDESYPKVYRCSSNSYGSENVYNEYRYKGNLYDLLDQYELGPTRVIPMKDCFF